MATGARDDVRLVDAHTHTQPSAAAARAFVEGLGMPVEREGTPADLVATMDRVGVAWSLIVSLVFAQDAVDAAVAGGADRDAATADVLRSWHELNAWAAGAAAASGGRLRAVVGVDPVLMSTAEIDREVRAHLAAGAGGIKVAPMFLRLRPDDERMEAVWRLAVELDVPVLSECGATAYGGTEVFGHPRYFAEVVRSYPALRLQLAHLGLGAEEDMAEVVRLSDTVVTDTAMRLGGRGRPLDTAGITETIRRIGVDRVVFGTNYPMIDQADHAAALRSLPLDDEELHQVGYANAARLWGGAG
ncbi:amidohydrolase family protein [Trujillonella endophytica]|uniref:Amidohydrolase n=1 Tax=Trujillonella endophytica TaxID=673521 RepID=A0A1H8R4D9_9ACTN|nr:amidohydrolase family protein [Trujillella endophytica]SEO61181.1 Amidohydrolase [Trujillella endophytica]